VRYEKGREGPSGSARARRAREALSLRLSGEGCLLIHSAPLTVHAPPFRSARSRLFAGQSDQRQVGVRLHDPAHPQGGRHECGGHDRPHERPVLGHRPLGRRRVVGRYARREAHEDCEWRRRAAPRCVGLRVAAELCHPLLSFRVAAELCHPLLSFRVAAELCHSLLSCQLGGGSRSPAGGGSLRCYR
jgi:hypothetical protein